MDCFHCGSETLSFIECTELVDQLRKREVSFFDCWWPVDRPVSLSQTSQLKTHFTQSISNHFPAKTQHRLVFKKLFSCDKKVKQTLYRPSAYLQVDSHISRQSAHEGSKVINPTYRQLLPPRNIRGTISAKS